MATAMAALLLLLFAEVVSFILALIRLVSYDTHVALCHVRENSTDFSKRTAFVKAAKWHLHPPLLVVFKAVQSSRSLVMLNGLLTRYQGSSWEKQAYIHTNRTLNYASAGPV